MHFFQSMRNWGVDSGNWLTDYNTYGEKTSGKDKFRSAVA
jgi:hypothetical protein